MFPSLQRLASQNPPRPRDDALVAAVKQARLHAAFVCSSGENWTTVATGTPEDEDEYAVELSRILGGPVLTVRNPEHVFLTS